MKFSIIIPTLNEEKLIGSSIEACLKAGGEEIIISDGGSTDRTVEIASRFNSILIDGSPGRGAQLRAAAEAASGDLFVFVHADTLIAPSCLEQIREFSDSIRHKNCWGCFRQKIRKPARRFRWLEEGNAWRAAKRGYVYGDQAMWITRDLYHQVGGFSKDPLMEDVIISERLRKISMPAVLPGPVYLTGRHWERRGVVRTTIRNWILFQKYKTGVNPKSIAQKY